MLSFCAVQTYWWILHHLNIHYKLTKLPSPSRALHRYCRGHGLESHSDLNFFQIVELHITTMCTSYYIQQKLSWTDIFIAWSEAKENEGTNKLLIENDFAYWKSLGLNLKRCCMWKFQALREMLYARLPKGVPLIITIWNTILWKQVLFMQWQI